MGTAANEEASVVGVILEWTLTLTVIANFYSMAVDVEGFNFVYELRTSEKVAVETVF